jgi:hypothetical protein
VSVAQADTTGYFRLNGIPSGRYYITAGLSTSPTYYPGVLESIDAKTVNVVAGSTVAGIDFALLNPVEIVVTGRVVIEGGGALPLDVAGLIGAAIVPNNVPKPTALMRMISARASDGSRASTTVRADGSFTLPLPPGGTQIVVQSLPMGYYVKSIFAGALDILRSPFTVDEGPLPEIVVTLTRTAPSSNPPVATVSGRVTGVPADGAPRWVILQSGTAGPAVFGIPATIAEIPVQNDGTFEAGGVPVGSYFINPLQTGQAPAARQPLVVPREGLSGIEVTWPAARPVRGAPSPRPIPGFNVRGRVETIPGATMPPQARLVSLSRPQPTKEAAVSGDGTFEFSDVTSGAYELHVGRDALLVGRNFTVGNQDIGGAQIKSAVETRGRVVMADGSKMPSPVFQIQSQYAGGYAGDPRPSPTIQREFDVNVDGTFTVGGVHGEQRISVLGLPLPYSVKSITYGSTDLLTNPLVLSSPPTSEIEVTLERTSAAVPNFSFVYQYGHDTLLRPNSIDSVRGTFTKDMIGDPSHTFNLRLTPTEVDQIEKKLVDIDFWNAQKYPSVFTMPNPGPMGCSSTGRQPIFLFVVRSGTSKELTWMDQDLVCGAPNPAGADLRSLMKLIQGIIGSKPEFQQLPKPRGMYID